MKLKTIYLLLFLLYSGISHAQHGGHNKLDSIFKSNFATLTSVAKGLTDQNKLSPEKSAFLYLIVDWAGDNVPFNHFSGLKFNTRDVRNWKTWYQNHRQQIDQADYDRYSHLFIKLITEGMITDSEQEEMEAVAMKYRALR